ncbi:T-complex protein 1 subunit epsilon-like [Culex pipiens pallens]|uniref:T-complex protein 1 subunit epsilon-like n=1 Tax=Culex pipiens pallens TaxID=42434 RepID=UPI001953D4E4|nr:T-complex protein 1 subunit epsilon-like [Culex pipiens pallens]
MMSGDGDVINSHQRWRNHFEADRCRSRDRLADGAAVAVTGRGDRRPGNSSDSYCRWVELAAQCAIKHMDSIASPFPISLDNKEPLIHLAMTARRIVNKCHRTMAEIAVDAVLTVADLVKR